MSCQHLKWRKHRYKKSTFSYKKIKEINFQQQYNLYNLASMKDNHFQLSSSFKNLINSKQKTKEQKSLEKGQKKSSEKKLFKLNPKSADPISDMPMQIMKKKSKSRLESLKDDDHKWSVINNKPQQPEIKEKQRRKHVLSYAQISQNILGHDRKEALKKKDLIEQEEQSELPSDMVKPSTLKSQQTSSSLSNSQKHTIFQTPLLPCFSSEFSQSNEGTQFKQIREKQGVWRIGKVKFNKDTGTLVMGGIQFEIHRAEAMGKAGSVQESSFYELPNWSNIWVVQPKQELFDDQN